MTKLHVTRQALHLRRRHPEWFGPDGDYTPLAASGPRSDHVVAFARGREPGSVTVVPRLPIKLGGRWDDTAVELPPGRWHNELTGETLEGGRAAWPTS